MIEITPGDPDSHTPSAIRYPLVEPLLLHGNKHRAIPGPGEPEIPFSSERN
jgi:hypothetical protein